MISYDFHFIKKIMLTSYRIKKFNEIFLRNKFYIISFDTFNLLLT